MDFLFVFYRHLNLNASENDPSLSEANETQSSVPASTETKAVRKAEVGVRDSNMSVLNWVFNKKETDLSTSVDPAYIERLQDDMKIAVSNIKFFRNMGWGRTISC